MELEREKKGTLTPNVMRFAAVWAFGALSAHESTKADQNGKVEFMSVLPKLRKSACQPAAAWAFKRTELHIQQAVCRPKAGG